MVKVCSVGEVSGGREGPWKANTCFHGLRICFLPASCWAVSSKGTQHMWPWAEKQSWSLVLMTSAVLLLRRKPGSGLLKLVAAWTEPSTELSGLPMQSTLSHSFLPPEPWFVLMFWRGRMGLGKHLRREMATSEIQRTNVVYLRFCSVIRLNLSFITS